MAADPSRQDPFEDTAEQMWAGALPVPTYLTQHLPGPAGRATDGVWLIPALGNVVVITTDEGLVLVDAAGQRDADHVADELDRVADAPVHTIVATHGHTDHIGGVARLDQRAADHGDPRPRLVSHAALTTRIDRYDRLGGWNLAINRRQSGNPALTWPERFRDPDLTHADGTTLTVGTTTLVLHAARGETDDHTWVHLPDHDAVCPGDLFIWVCPNAGNPQKVQRYAAEWAQALRTMDALGASLLLPGHGPWVRGTGRVHEALSTTAALLETLDEQVVALMNTGATLEEVVARISWPDDLLARPWLRPLYDEPEFIVRNLWRLYGGWWDGDPSHLHPAPPAALAAELADLAGGAAVLAARAEALAGQGDLRLAGHLAQLAVQAAPGDPAVVAVHAAVNARRAEDATSMMARGVYADAVRQSSSAGS